MRLRKLVLFILIVMLALPALSYASGLTMEYRVYAGYDAILNAFKKISLIFNSGIYKGLFMGIVGVGATVTLIGTALKGIGGKAGYGQALAMFLAGMTLFGTLFVPTGSGSSLQMFDPVRGTSEQVGNLPDGIVMLAGTLNKVEMSVVEFIVQNGDTGIYGTYGSYLSYPQMPGGLGFTLLEAATGSTVLGRAISPPMSPSLKASLGNYIYDCYLPAVELPSDITPIDIEKLGTTITSVNTELQKAASTTSFTKIIDGISNQGAGKEVSCFDAWYSEGSWQIKDMGANYAGLLNTLTALNNDTIDENNPALKAVCGTAGFDVTSATSMQKCNSVLVALYKQTAKGNSAFLADGGGGNGGGLYWQANIAKMIKEAPSTGAQAGMSQNQQMMNQGLGAMMGDWLPIGKAIMTAVAISLMPILVLFMLTPAWPKALGTIIGFFVWIAAWGMTDALTHSIALDYTLQYIDGLTQHSGAGLADLMALPNASAKAMSMFGLVRGSGAALATMLAGLVTAYGGHALGGVAGGAVSQVQSSGSSAQQKVGSHEGRKQIEDSSSSAGAIMSVGGYGAYGLIQEDHARNDLLSKNNSLTGYLNQFGDVGSSGRNDAALTVANGTAGKIREGFLGEVAKTNVHGSGQAGVDGRGQLGYTHGTQDQSMLIPKVGLNEKLHKEVSGDMIEHDIKNGIKSGEFTRQDYLDNKNGIKDRIDKKANDSAWEFQAIAGNSMKPGEAASSYIGKKTAAQSNGVELNPYMATQDILAQNSGKTSGFDTSRANFEKITGTQIPPAEWARIQNSGGTASWTDAEGRTNSVNSKAMLGKPGEFEMTMTTRGKEGTETSRALRQDANGNIVQTAVAETHNGSAVKLGSMQQADGSTQITDVGKELVTGSITEGRSALASAIATQSLSKTTGDTEQWSHALKAGLSSSKSSELANNLSWATSDGLKTMEGRNTEMSDSTKKAAATAMTLAGKAGISLGVGTDGLRPSGSIGGNLSADEKRSFEHAVSTINKDSVSSGHDWGKSVSDTYSEATKKAWSKTFTADDTKQIAHQIGVTDVDQINNARQIANKVDMNVTGTEAQVNYLNGLNNEKAGSDHKFSSKPASPERVEEVAAWVAKNPSQHKSEFQDFLQSTTGLGSVASLGQILNDTKPAVDFQSKASGTTQGLQKDGEAVHKSAEKAVAPTMKEVAPAKTAGGVKPVKKDHFLQNTPSDVSSFKMLAAQNNSAKASKDMKDSSLWTEPVSYKLTDSNPGDNKNSTFFSSVSKAQVPMKSSGGKGLGPSYSALGGAPKTQYNVTNPGGWTSPEIGNKGERK